MQFFLFFKNFLYMFCTLKDVAPLRIKQCFYFLSFQKFFAKLRVYSFLSSYFVVHFLFCKSLNCLALNFSNRENLDFTVIQNRFSKKDSFSIHQHFKIFSLLSYLKYSHFIDLTAVDFLGKAFFPVSDRFQLIYIFSSLFSKFSPRLIWSFFCSESSFIYSITDLFPAVGWAEREVWDFFGIRFFRNSDMRRLLNDYGFRGFPLRKDFPTVGFKQVKFDELQDSVVYEDLFLMQEDRELAFVNPWIYEKKQRPVSFCCYDFVIFQHLLSSFQPTKF